MVVLGFAFALNLSPVGLAENSLPETEAHYSYHGPAGIVGSFLGSCPARGAVLPTGTVEIPVAGGLLSVRHTRVNVTFLSPASNPIPLVDPDRQWEERFELRAGVVKVQVSETGMGVVLPWGYARGPFESFQVDLAAKILNGSAPETGMPTPFSSLWTVEDGKPVLTVASFGSTARAIQVEGEATTARNVSVYLRDAIVASPGRVTATGPWRTEEFNITTPPVARRQLVLTDAFLDLRSPRLAFPAATDIICGGLSGTVRGGLAAGQSAGSIERDGETRSFAGRVISLEGRFTLQETAVAGPDGAGVEATARGDIAVTELDFKPLSQAAPTPIVGTVSLGVALLALLIVLLKNLGSVVGTLYSRFGRDRALENPNRDQIYQAVIGEPGVALSQLATATSFHISTVAYHVQVLRRVGLVRTLRHGRAVRVLPMPAQGKPDLAAIVRARDDRVNFILQELGAGPMSLSDLVHGIQVRFGMTRRAAYMNIERAQKYGLVNRSGSGRGTVIQCN